MAVDQRRVVAMAERLAYTGADRQLHLWDTARARQITWPQTANGTLWQGITGSDGRLGVVWSPDGQWLACFHLDGSEDQAMRCRVCVVQIDGVEEEVLVELAGCYPVCLQWHPDSSRLAVLVQSEEELQLWVCRLHQVGTAKLVEQGAPLFFCWAPHLHHIAVHAGDAHRSGHTWLAVRNLMPNGEDGEVNGQPGAFRVPMYVQNRLLYAVRRRQQTVLCLSACDGTAPEELAHMHGPVAVLPAPKGDWIAVRGVKDAQHPTGARLWLVSKSGSPPKVLSTKPGLAFFWLPCGQQLLVAQPDRAMECMHWMLVDIEQDTAVALATFWPSRDQLFYLHFFEQFAQSHPQISSDGRHLVYASHPDPRRSGDRQSLIWRLDLHSPSQPPEALATGSFGVFAPWRS